MALEIFRLVGSVFVDTDEANKSIKKADESAEGLGKKLLKGIGTAAKWAAGLTAAAGAGAAALYGVAMNAASAMDVIDKGSAKIGISKQAYQEWSYVLGQNGMDISRLETGMKSLLSSMDSAASGTKSAQANFDTLGVSIYDATGKLKDQETMLQETLYALANMENGTEKARLATELFGKAGVEMMPMLNGGAEGMAELTKRAHELGLVVSDEAVTAGVVLGDTMDDVKQSLTAVKNKIGVEIMPLVQSGLDWILAHMPKIQSTCSTVFSVVAVVVSTAVEWFGKAADVIGDLAEQALPVVSAAFDTVVGGVKQAVNLFKSLASWAEKNKTALGLVAIAVGTLTTAIIAYNAAQAIKNAGGIVELAQLAATAVGVGALTAVETAHTIATTIATVATTAFGAAVNFLTAPITLVILAIGALIAIVVLLVKNWDEVKAFAIKCWEGIKAAWSAAGEWFNSKVVEPIERFFKSLFDGIKTAASNAWTGVKNTWSVVTGWFRSISSSIQSAFSSALGSVKTAFSNAWSSIKNVWGAVSGWFSNLASGIQSAFSSALSSVKNLWSGISGWFGGLLDGVKSLFSACGSAIGGAFKAPINTIINGINVFIRGLNKIQIPDGVPGVGGKGFHISTIPNLYEGAVLEKGQTGFLEGNGAEAVVPLHQNQKWISAVAQDMAKNGLGGGASEEMLEAFLAFVAALPDILKEALSNMKLSVGGREFGRIVKAVR